MELNDAQLRRDVIVIGASAGGFDPVFTLLAATPADGQVIVAVVIHRSPFGGPSVLAQLIEHRVRRPAVEPKEPVQATPGVIYAGPRDLHLVFDRGCVVGVRSAKQHFTRPAVDPLFLSAADTYGQRVLGLLLSGGGSDGVLGLAHIKACGGMSLVQSPGEARHPSMPVAALRQDHVDAALPVAELVRILPALARGRRVETDGVGPTGWAGAAAAASPAAAVSGSAPLFSTRGRGS